MALTKCKECEGTVSTMATTCPHCGYPLKRSYKKEVKKLPNGFGTIRFYDRNLRNPYGAFPKTKSYDNNGNAIRGKAIGYYPTYQDAYKALCDYNKSPYDTDARSLTVREVYEMYYDDKFVKNKKRVYSESSKGMVSSSFKHLSSIENKSLIELKHNDLQEVIDNLKLRHAGCEGVVFLLKELYKFGIKNEICASNNAQYLRINIPDDDEKGVPFSEEELNLLWDNKDNQVVQLILLLIYTGFRITEFLKAELNEEEMYFQGGLKTKAGRNRIVPINDNVKGFIDAYKSFNMTSATFRTRFSETLESLHIGKSSKDTKHTPHDCRHTFSWLCDKYNVDEFSKHLLMGHSLGSDVEKSVYGHRTVEELRKEINKIPPMCKECK